MVQEGDHAEEALLKCSQVREDCHYERNSSSLLYRCTGRKCVSFIPNYFRSIIFATFRNLSMYSRKLAIPPLSSSLLACISPFHSQPNLIHFTSLLRLTLHHPHPSHLKVAYSTFRRICPPSSKAHREFQPPSRFHHRGRRFDGRF